MGTCCQSICTSNILLTLYPVGLVLYKTFVPIACYSSEWSNSNDLVLVFLDQGSISSQKVTKYTHGQLVSLAKNSIYMSTKQLLTCLMFCAAIATVVTIAEILKNNGFAVEKS